MDDFNARIRRRCIAGGRGVEYKPTNKTPVVYITVLHSKKRIFIRHVHTHGGSRLDEGLDQEKFLRPRDLGMQRPQHRLQGAGACNQPNTTGPPGSTHEGPF